MIKLIHGDCLKEMKKIPDDSINMILTDPPYPDHYTEEFKYSPDLMNILTQYSCRQFIFWSAKVKFPLDYSAVHVWDKITGAACQYDFIYERNGHKRQKVFRGHRINSTVSAQFAKEKFFNHKSQKPLLVLNNIIVYAKMFGVVFDPFMGTGSTGVACVKLNNDFVGIEINKKFYEIAKERIRDEFPKE